ncbi:MAG: hypothetical protein ABDH28_05965 [Brevinematia bacterium]
MLKEIAVVIVVIVSFFMLGVLISLAGLDYTVAKYYSDSKDLKEKKVTNKPKPKLESEVRYLLVEVITSNGREVVAVDEGTTELEVFSIMGGRVKNILTISNLLKIITNVDSKIDLR